MVTAPVYADGRDYPMLLLFLHQEPTPGQKSQAVGPPPPPPPAPSSTPPGVQLNGGRAGSNSISSLRGRRRRPPPPEIRALRARARAGAGQVKSNQFAPRLYQQVA